VSRRLAFALLAMMAGQAVVYIARPATSYRLLGLGEDARAVGLVTAAYAIVPLFLAIPLGRLTDRRPATPLLVGGCGLEIGACLLLAAARTPVGLAVASALLGLGHLCVALGAQAVIARESAEESHDQHFGLLTVGVSLGQLIGPLIAGAVLSSRDGTSLEAATTRAMVVAAVVGLAAALCAAVAERGRAPAVTAAHAPSHGGPWAIVRTRGVAAGIFASIAVLSATDIVTAYLPLLGEQNGIGPGVVGILLALRAAASMASRLGIGAIVGRVGRLRLIALGGTASAAAFAGVTLTSDPVVLGVLMVVAGLALGFGQPLSMTLVVQRVPEHARGTALAVRLAGNRLGQVAAPAVGGLIAGSAGVASVFWLMGATLLASGAAVLRPPPREEPDEVVVAESVVE
jgi:MFS family permease